MRTVPDQTMAEGGTGANGRILTDFDSRSDHRIGLDKAILSDNGACTDNRAMFNTA